MATALNKTLNRALDILENSFRGVWDRGATKPTVAAGAAAGASPTVAVADGSNDCVGQVTVTTGTTTTTGTLFTVTFNKPYSVNAPYVIVWPADNASGIATSLAAGAVTTSTFKAELQADNLADSTAYKFNYFVIG